MWKSIFCPVKFIFNAKLGNIFDKNVKNAGEMNDLIFWLK